MAEFPLQKVSHLKEDYLGILWQWPFQNIARFNNKTSIA